MTTAQNIFFICSFYFVDRPGIATGFTVIFQPLVGSFVSVAKGRCVFCWIGGRNAPGRNLQRCMLFNGRRKLFNAGGVHPLSRLEGFAAIPSSVISLVVITLGFLCFSLYSFE